jgi:hypothetical protein
MSTRAFAVGAGNVDGAIFAMWMFEMIIELQTVFQSFLVTAGSLLLKHGQLVI